MKVCEMIKDLRKRTGMTLKDLSYLTGVSQATVYNWESGKCTPSVVVQFGLKYMSENNLLVCKKFDIKF